MINLKVQQQYFDAIESGEKTIEGRLAKSKYRNLTVGERIIFSNNQETESITKTVTAVYIYPTFEKAFEKQNYKHAIPHAKNVQEALDIYESFYPQNDQKKFGVVFIEVS